MSSAGQQAAGAADAVRLPDAARPFEVGERNGCAGSGSGASVAVETLAQKWRSMSSSAPSGSSAPVKWTWRRASAPGSSSFRNQPPAWALRTKRRLVVRPHARRSCRRGRCRRLPRLGARTTRCVRRARRRLAAVRRRAAPAGRRADARRRPATEAARGSASVSESTRSVSATA